MGGDVAVEIHAHEAAELKEARIDEPHHAGIGPRHLGDDVVANQLRLRPLANSFTAVGFTRASMGPAIRIIERGTAGSFIALHQRHGGEHRHGRLADRHDVHVAPEESNKINDVVDVSRRGRRGLRRVARSARPATRSRRPRGREEGRAPCRAAASDNGPRAGRRSGACGPCGGARPRRPARNERDCRMAWLITVRSRTATLRPPTRVS